MLNRLRLFLRKRTWKKVHAIMNMGKDCEIALSNKFIFPENLTIGDYVYIGPNGTINAMGSVIIGKGTVIGPSILILSGNHCFDSDLFIPYDNTHVLKPVEIGVGCWIGANVIIAPGSKIGKGVIVGAGSVISGVVEDYAIIVGNPAKVIKYRDIEKFDKLLKSESFYLKAKRQGIIKPDFNGK